MQHSKDCELPKIIKAYLASGKLNERIINFFSTKKNFYAQIFPLIIGNTYLFCPDCLNYFSFEMPKDIVCQVCKKSNDDITKSNDLYLIKTRGGVHLIHFDCIQLPKATYKIAECNICNRIVIDKRAKAPLALKFPYLYDDIHYAHMYCLKEKKIPTQISAETENRLSKPMLFNI
jgi:hypothetical protein